MASTNADEVMQGEPDEKVYDVFRHSPLRYMVSVSCACISVIETVHLTQSCVLGIRKRGGRSLSVSVSQLCETLLRDCVWVLCHGRCHYWIRHVVCLQASSRKTIPRNDHRYSHCRHAVMAMYVHYHLCCHCCGRSTLRSFSPVILFLLALASVMIPGATINAIVKASRLAAVKMSLPVVAAAWGPTFVGLASIPIIIRPIDHGVDYLLDNTTRAWTTEEGENKE